MPNPNEYENESEWMGVCVPAMVDEGKDNDQAVAACMSMWANKQDAAKYRLTLTAVKAVGDWELDVLAAPFNRPDSDGQTFDESTDFMLDSFSSPVILYHHGIEPGKRNLQKKPVIIGKSNYPQVQADGVHIRVMLNQSLEWARRVWDAAKAGRAVASSDSIGHIARLEVNGKTIMYEKNRPGKISVWPLAGVSLWDNVSTNFQPASRYAIGMPVMKAIYRDGGLLFPEELEDTNGGDARIGNDAAHRARVAQLQSEAKKLITALEGKE